jgi:hypothetical protein
VSLPAPEEQPAVVITQPLASEQQPLETAIDLNNTIKKTKTTRTRKETQKLVVKGTQKDLDKTQKLAVKGTQKDLDKTQKRRLSPKTTTKLADPILPQAEQPAQEA